MLSILIAEDDKPLARALELYLEQLGFRVSVHDTVDAARQAAVEAPGGYLFALIDYQIGKGCGLELSRWLLGQYPDMCLVLMSGYPPDEKLNLATLGDRAIFLQKPFHPKDVISCFRSLRPMLMMSV
jgi:DNA-binding response OmpR family regulator